MMIADEGKCIRWNDECGTNLLTVWREQDPEDPRRAPYEPSYGHMICFSRYVLGDTHTYGDPVEFARSLADEFHVRYDFNELSDAIMDRIAERGHIVYMPLWIYEHGGLSMSCGKRVGLYADRWDSCQVGYIYMTRAEALHMGYAPKNWKERAVGLLTVSVSEYNDFLNGDIYGYTRYTLNDDSIWEEEESVGGFYGSDNAVDDIRGFAGVPEDAVTDFIGDIRPEFQPN